ncbi:hypothetical protein B0H13DRAFT_2357969 [Mycena leptocephala]|nr:hypothetical protein B0H13DRAFT_2357969 [Mycena leptocephala]
MPTKPVHATRLFGAVCRHPPGRISVCAVLAVISLSSTTTHPTSTPKIVKSPVGKKAGEKPLHLVSNPRDLFVYSPTLLRPAPAAYSCFGLSPLLLPSIPFQFVLSFSLHTYGCTAESKSGFRCLPRSLLDNTFTHPFGDVSTHPSGFIASEHVRSVEILLSVKVRNLFIFSNLWLPLLIVVPPFRCTPPLLFTTYRPFPLPMPAATTHPLRILKHISLLSPPYCVPTASKRDHDIPFGASQSLWLLAAHGRRPAVTTFSPSIGLTRSPSSSWHLSTRQG